MSWSWIIAWLIVTWLKLSILTVTIAIADDFLRHRREYLIPPARLRGRRVPRRLAAPQPPSA